MGGAGGNLLGVPWGLGEGGPCLVFPRESNPHVREPLELFPTSASGPLGVGVRSGTAEAAPPPPNPQVAGVWGWACLHCGRTRGLAGVRGVCGVCAGCGCPPGTPGGKTVRPEGAPFARVCRGAVRGARAAATAWLGAGGRGTVVAAPVGRAPACAIAGWRAAGG